MMALRHLPQSLRFAWGLQDFLRHPISLEEAEATVRRRMAQREENFLLLVERAIFGYPDSPYLPMLKLAGCEFGDIRDMVRNRGVEQTLRTLREAGVYVTYDEYRARAPIVRASGVIPLRPRAFDNPFLSHYYRAESGGTTGRPVVVNIDLHHLADQATYDLLTRHANGVMGVPEALWRGTLPDGSGIGNILRGARIGNVPRKWFSPIGAAEDRRGAFKHRFVTQFVVLMGRVCGVPIPWPETVPLDRAAVVAQWVGGMLKAHGSCLVRAHVSMALRVCLAARQAGLDLTGATFLGGGEPPTPGKVRQIIETGARWIPWYVFSEVGRVGMGCARPVDGNDLHFRKDGLALIQYPRPVLGSRIVNAFYFTTLLPTAPKVLLNVESDDYGVMEQRSCGCLLEQYGFTDHLREVRSFRKLTGEGVTLVGGDMERILDEVLPARFGGSPLDYQFLEEEDAAGFTRLTLAVSPKVQIADEAAVVEVVLRALRGDNVRSLLEQAKTLRVKRMEPISTSRGKILPLHLLSRFEASDKDTTAGDA
jgi:hypothetical protein